MYSYFSQLMNPKKFQGNTRHGEWEEIMVIITRLVLEGTRNEQ